ncbi:MAG: vWA domain-containing protein [Fervidobacterium sp.]
MRKLFYLGLIISALAILLYSCSNIPTVPRTIPPDPTGMTKPDIADYSSEGIYGSIDLEPALIPVTVPEYVKVRLSIPEVENITAGDLKVFEDNKAQGFTVYKESNVRNKIDIAIILDVTGSMSEEIEGVKNSIISFATALEESGLDVRIGVIPFDDYVNPPSDIVINQPYLPLTTPQQAKEYVSQLYAGDGGDWYENDYDGIMFAATALEWRPYAQKVMILITDAPSHYKSDGDGFAHFDKTDMFPTLLGHFVIHGAFVPDYEFYTPSDDNFSAPEDPRELCQKTGGMIKYTDEQGNIDLTSLGIIDYVKSSWIITFESDSPANEHTIEIFFNNGSTKKYLKLEHVTY